MISFTVYGLPPEGAGRTTEGRGMIAFTVYGLPQAKGSTKSWVHKSTGRVVTTSTSKGLRSWHQEVAHEAMRVKPPGPLPDGPIEVRMEFLMRKPKKFAKRCPAWHTTRPDLDKLERAVLDALTGILYLDDAQVCSVNKTKTYASQSPGVIVRVVRLESA